jgi:hypothetical protein
MVAAAAVCGFLAQPAFSAENFIPSGQTYSPDRGSLPLLNSEQDLINLQADIFQSEINVIQRQRKLQDNEFSRFLYNQDLDGTDFNRLDY